MRPRVPLAAIFLAILLAFCGARPGLTVSIAGAVVPTVIASATEGTACPTSRGDAFPQDLPLTTVSALTPITLQFEAGQGATQIRGCFECASSHDRAYRRSRGDWNYGTIRRLLVFVEESLFGCVRWVVFEPKDRSL